MSDLKLLHVHNCEKMGLLIKEIASGAIPRPETPEQLNTLLIDRGIVDRPTPAEVADGIERHWPNGRPAAIQYVEIPNGTMMISLPSPEAIREGRRLAGRLTTDGSYPFDRGYDVNYREPRRKPSLTASEWEKMYWVRLGDYTIGKCM